MATEYLTTDIDLKKVADGIRSRTGKTTPLAFPDGYVTEISTLTNTSADTVTADKLLKGTTAHDKSGSQVTGTYVPLDTSDATATAADIAKKKTAYVNGTKVTGTVETVGPGEVYGTATPSVRVSGNYIMAEDELREDFLLRKDSLIQLKMDPMKFGLAQNKEVLSGKSFTSMVGFKAKGTMPNNGAKTLNIVDKAKPVTIPQGYHDGSGKAQIDATEAAKIIANNIRQGITILGVAGSMSGTEGAKAQAKTATPSFSEQVISPDTTGGYNYLSQVTVKAIPVTYVDNEQGGQTVTVG